MSTDQRHSDTLAARGLGWASLGIGLLEVAAPKQVERLLGIDGRAEQQGLLRVLGVRELMHGLGLLTERKPSSTLATGLWARVAGDALDTVLLALAARKTKHPARFAAVSAVVLGIGLLDAICAARASATANPSSRAAVGRSLSRRSQS